MLVYSEYIKVYNIKGESVKRVFDNSNPLDRTNIVIEEVGFSGG